jgi:formate hydrogenlyase subunit 3/multisubunit Na+/H+ antiporter MnhD subunit
MHKRPHSVTVISGLFLAAGAVGLAYHITEFNAKGPFQYDLVWVCLVRLLAIICAVFMLRAGNWARWLLVIWIAYHVILSAFHSLAQLMIHSLLLAVVAYFLFRPSASTYFRGARAASAQANRDSVTR